MSQYEENKDYRIEGKVLDRDFSNSVYSKTGDGLAEIADECAYAYAEGNYSCDCNKRLFAGFDEQDDDDCYCGDTIKYEELFLVYKDEMKVDLLTSWRFKE